MMHMRLFTGSSRRRDLKMVLIKARSGPLVISILDLGRITRSAALVSKFIRMARNMKEAGSTISDMGKALYGFLMRAKISEEDILVIGSMIKKREEEPCSLATKIDTMDSGKTTDPRVRAV
jgi:hypothetical protein